MTIQRRNTTNLIIGIVATLGGIFSLINLINEWRYFGFEQAYLQSYGFMPAWLFVIFMLIGGIYLIKDNIKKNKK
ncbi:hypothetical protein GOV13_03845 [Candidatus Pacearchaeota archaeon]|nr:hypothetical protein [Candidatus Pacearchaeota archaeon]